MCRTLSVETVGPLTLGAQLDEHNEDNARERNAGNAQVGRVILSLLPKTNHDVSAKEITTRHQRPPQS